MDIETTSCAYWVFVSFFFFFFILIVLGGRFLHVPEKVIASYKGTATITIRFNISEDTQDVTTPDRKFKQILVEYTDKNNQDIVIATGTNSEFFLNRSPFKDRSKTNYTILDADNGIFELEIGDLAYNDDMNIKTILLYNNAIVDKIDSESSLTYLIIQGK